MLLSDKAPIIFYHFYYLTGQELRMPNPTHPALIILSTEPTVEIGKRSFVIFYKGFI